MLTTKSRRTRAVLLAAATAALALAAAAEPAHGGTYAVAICNPDLRSWHADAAFAHTSPHYASDADCGSGGAGLSVTHSADATRSGAWGAWTLRSPAGTVIRRAGATAGGAAAAGHTPELLTAAPGAGLLPFAHPAGAFRRFRWQGRAASQFAARLRCHRTGGCARGRRAAVRVKRIALRLEDSTAPTLRLRGSLLEPGSRRGVQTVAPSAGDVGGGVRRFLLQVNGRPVVAHAASCRLSGAVALRLRPCPERADADFAAATASPPFRQGRNHLRVCVADFASTTAANRSCAARRVRIDNLCPVSPIGGAASIHARVRRGDAGTTVAGRLLGAGGNGVSGATVCVASRVRTHEVERIVATPVTGPDGRFRAAIPTGPSRELRVAYWPNEASALERYLHLRVRVRPRLRVSPRHPIRNGNRVHFEVRLPGPANAMRRVRIQARSGRRWLELRAGRSNPDGLYRGRYRFHGTTDRRRYAFRALVPRQAGYPYEAGRSAVRHVVVVR